MKRMVVALCVLVLLAGLTKNVAAHAMGLMAVVSTIDDQLTVRIEDPYGNKVNRVQVSAGANLLGKKPGIMVPLPQIGEGTYKGKLTPPAVKEYQIQVEAIVLEEKLTAAIEVKAGQTLNEQRAYFISADEKVAAASGLSIQMIGFLVAIVIVATVTGIAVLRKRPAD